MQIPDATPRPGELAREVIQSGYMRGFLQAGGDRIPYLDISWCCDQKLSQNVPLVLSVQAQLEPLRLSEERGRFIEQFIQKVELERVEDPLLQKFYDAVRNLEERHLVPHPMGLGYVAIHLYYHHKI